jgi:hypothetical protein
MEMLAHSFMTLLSVLKIGPDAPLETYKTIISKGSLTLRFDETSHVGTVGRYDSF